MQDFASGPTNTTTPEQEDRNDAMEQEEQADQGFGTVVGEESPVELVKEQAELALGLWPGDLHEKDVAILFGKSIF